MLRGLWLDDVIFHKLVHNILKTAHADARKGDSRARAWLDDVSPMLASQPRLRLDTDIEIEYASRRDRAGQPQAQAA